ncbi:MAG: hypothetical protein U0835_10790 [Isosphaeraceae bacterium]
MKRDGLVRRLHALALAALLTGSTPVWADFLLPNHSHTETVTNNTGKTANDLHVNLVHPATGKNPTAPPFPNSSGTGDTHIDFSGANVANGGKAVVNWQSKFASDTLFPGNEGNWTFNNGDIGAVTVAASYGLNFQDNGGGSVTVSLVNNESSPITYSNLQVYNNADGAFFSPQDYLLGGQTTGTPVSLLVGPSGSFSPGSTPVVTFNPTLDPALYSSGSVLLNGNLIGLGSSSVPEPGPLHLALLLSPALLMMVKRRRARARATA